MYTHIAIDGPSAAGKSTLSKKIAEELGFCYMDTGALYRAVAFRLLELGCGEGTPTDIIISNLQDIDVQIGFTDSQRVYINGDDVTDRLRTPVISSFSSAISAIPEVRAMLIDLQRDYAEGKNIIMDGRDIGTNVLPGAHIKIFITADPSDRAQRRYEELTAKGVQCDFESVKRDIIRRDEQDINKNIAPLKRADDAILVDTTGNTFEKSLEVMMNIISKRI